MPQKIIFTSYAGSPEYTKPDEWLQRIGGYTGIMERLALNHEVIGIERIDYEGVLDHKGVKYYFIRQRKKTLYLPLRMHRLIKKQKPDVVIVHGLIFPLQLIQLRLSLEQKVKIIAQNHAEKPATGLRKLLQKLADHVIQCYLFTSHEMGMEWVNKGIIRNEKKIVEVMEASSTFHVTDKDLARERLNISGSQVFLWVGRLDDNKDPLTVIKAFLAYSKQNPDARLYMIYQTEDLLSEVQSFVSTRNSIQLVGRVSHSEMQEWYNAADFIISSSHYEGSGVAVCEAMSCACIPIVTNIASFRKMTRGCGILYSPGDERALTVALITTMEMDIGKERKKVLEQFQKELSFEAIAQQINHIIQT